MVGGITCGGNDNVNDSAGVQWDRRGWGACTQVAYCRRVARPTRKEEGDNLDSCGWLHVPLIPSHHACYDVDMPMKLLALRFLLRLCLLSGVPLGFRRGRSRGTAPTAAAVFLRGNAVRLVRRVAHRGYRTAPGGSRERSKARRAPGTGVKGVCACMCACMCWSQCSAGERSSVEEHARHSYMGSRWCRWWVGMKIMAAKMNESRRQVDANDPLSRTLPHTR
jgi:hypothetical protein